MLKSGSGQSKVWLLIDVANVAYRSYHVLKGKLSYGGDATETLYGVFRLVSDLMDLFATERVVFCFDGGHDYRASIYKKYKANRLLSPETPDEELVNRRELRKQIYRLRTRYLFEAGFSNVLWQEGVEADDLIASCCQWLSAKRDRGDAVIVSTDQDLWQLLSGDQVLIWNPATKKILNERSFVEKWKVSPQQWRDVKAIAGCKTDNIDGVDGVGEITACKFLSGTLNPTSQAFKRIVLDHAKWQFNLLLVSLPCAVTKQVELVDDVFCQKTWDKVMRSLGMNSLLK